MAPSLTGVGSRYITEDVVVEAMTTWSGAMPAVGKLEVLCPPSRYDDAETLPKTPLGVHKGCVGCCQRRVYVCCCIIAGEMDRGGLATLIPVLGLTMGIALRVRSADGW